MGQVDLKQPENMTSTSFRNHVATMTQLVNLKDNELDIVAQFLGHDVRTHREYYRLPTSTVQVAKVTKLLLEMEKGTGGDHEETTEILNESDESGNESEQYNESGGYSFYFRSFA